jgi:hypothetical protein
MKEPDCQLLDPTDTKRKHLSHMNVTLEDEILESPVKLVPQSEMKDISERSIHSNNANKSARLLTQEHVTGKSP